MAAAGHREGPECPWALQYVQPVLQGICVYPQSLGMNFVFFGGRRRKGEDLISVFYFNADLKP